jgi:hypothetical protein
MEPIVVGLISACVGFLGGHLHYKIGNSTCLYGLCSVSNLDLEMDKDANTNAVNIPINNK